MPGPPGSGSDEPPPAGTAPTPSVTSPADVPHDEQDAAEVINPTRGSRGRANYFLTDDFATASLHPAPSRRTNNWRSGLSARLRR